MKTLISCIFSCFIFSNAFSQAPVFALPQAIYYIDGYPNFVKVDNGYLGVKQVEHSKKFQAYQTIKTTVSVVKYDSKMVELSENMLSNGDLAFSLLTPQMVKGNKIWIFSGDPGSGSTRNWGDHGNIRATEIDPQTYKPGASKIIVTAKELHEEGVYGTYQMKIIGSPNLKYYCLYYADSYSNDFFLACLNSDMELVWKERKKIAKTKTDDINDLIINDNGEIIITSSIRSSSTLTIYNVNGAETSRQLNINNAEPAFIDILQSKSGNTYIGGTFFNNSKLVNAVFFAKLEKDYTLSDVKQVNFSDNILNRLAQHGLAKTGDKKTGLTGNYIHSELVEQHDGRIKLVTETTYSDTRLDNRFMGFGGLVITDFSKTENQFSLIQKFIVEYRMPNRINQFVVQPSSNNITVIYCDNAENINIDINEKQKTTNGPAVSALFAATIDNEGTIKREIIASRTDKEDKRTTAQIIQAFFANKK